MNINDWRSSGEASSPGASCGAARPPRRRLRGASSLPLAQLRPVERVEQHAADEHPRQAAGRYTCSVICLTTSSCLLGHVINCYGHQRRRSLCDDVSVVEPVQVNCW